MVRQYFFFLLFAFQGIASSLSDESFRYRPELQQMLYHWEVGGESLLNLLTVRDIGGELVVGVGHDVLPSDSLSVHDTITLKRASELFSQDTDKAIAGAMADVPNLLSYPRPVQLTLCAHAFQLGERGLSEFKKTLSLLREKNYKGASAELLRSQWARQTPERAKAMAYLLGTGSSHQELLGLCRSMEAGDVTLAEAASLLRGLLGR